MATSTAAADAAARAAARAANRATLTSTPPGARSIPPPAPPLPPAMSRTIPPPAPPVAQPYNPAPPQPPMGCPPAPPRPAPATYTSPGNVNVSDVLKNMVLAPQAQYVAGGGDPYAAPPASAPRPPMGYTPMPNIGMQGPPIPGDPRQGAPQPGPQIQPYNPFGPGMQPRPMPPMPQPTGGYNPFGGGMPSQGLPVALTHWATPGGGPPLLQGGHPDMSGAPRLNPATGRWEYRNGMTGTMMQLPEGYQPPPPPPPQPTKGFAEGGPVPPMPTGPQRTPAEVLRSLMLGLGPRQQANLLPFQRGMIGGLSSQMGLPEEDFWAKLAQGAPRGPNPALLVPGNF